MNNSYKDYHVGQRIKEVLDRKDLTLADFAKQINCQRANVYNIFSRKSINTDQLVIISKVLGYNFLEEMSSILTRASEKDRFWL